MSQTKKMTVICMVAAVYVAVSIAMAPISFGQIQLRIAECLNLLPLIFPASGYGVVLGCFLTNLIGTLNGTDIIGIVDCVVGTMGTVIGVLGVLKFKDVKFKNIPYLSILMPVISNGILVGIELGFILYPSDVVMGSIVSGIWVAIGELISMIVGYILVKELDKTEIFKK